LPLPSSTAVAIIAESPSHGALCCCSRHAVPSCHRIMIAIVTLLPHFVVPLPSSPHFHHCRIVVSMLMHHCHCGCRTIAIMPSLPQSLCSIVIAIPLGLHCHCHYRCCCVLAAAATIPSSHRCHVLAAAVTVPCHCNLVIVPSPSRPRCRVIAVVALPSLCHCINTISVAVLLPSCCHHAVVMSSSYHHCVLDVASLLCSCCHSCHAALLSSPMLIVASLPYHRCSPSHHRVAIAICPHNHSGCTLAATVAVLLRHHRSPSPSHEWACIEWDNATLRSRCCHKLHIMASGEQRGVSDLKAAVGWKPGHPLHKNIDRLHFAALPPSECLTLSG